MGRPISQGLPYFPLDTDFDDDVELFLVETESDGYAVLISLWQIVYKNYGFYVINDDKIIPKLKARSHVSAEKIAIILEKMLNYGLINAELFKKNIITSRGIQRRYFSAAKRKSQIEIFSEIMLIDVSEYKNVVIVNKNPVNDSIYTPNKSKQKQSIVNESKLNNSKQEQANHPPQNGDSNDQIIKDCLFNFIIKNNVSKMVATAVLKQKNYEFVMRKSLQLFWELNIARVNVENPSGYFLNMVTEDYTPRAGFDDWYLDYKHSNKLPKELQGLL